MLIYSLVVMINLVHVDFREDTQHGHWVLKNLYID